MIEKRFNHRSAWLLISTIVVGMGVAQALRLLPQQAVFWSFVGIGFFVLATLIIAVVMASLRKSRPEDLNSRTQFAWQNSVEDRLDELERLKRRSMVTPEEYEAKRQDILKDI